MEKSVISKKYPTETQKKKFKKKTMQVKVLKTAKIVMQSKLPVGGGGKKFILYPTNRTFL